jgi:hypothetical protein
MVSLASSARSPEVCNGMSYVELVTGIVGVTSRPVRKIVLREG